MSLISFPTPWPGQAFAKKRLTDRCFVMWKVLFLMSISTPLPRGRCMERNIALPTTCALATGLCRPDLGYKVNGSVDMTDPALVRA